MDLIYDIRRRMRAALVPAMCALAIGYFGYHAVEGDRGLVAWSRLTREISAATQELERVRAQKLILERRTALLESSSLDRDLLEERARAVLGLAHPDDVIIFQPR
jgi:cell division protein FtsB